MSVVDWSQAPYGAFAYTKRDVDYATWEICKIRDGGTLGDFAITEGGKAPCFDVLLGVHTRPSAAEAELRAEVAALESRSDKLQNDVENLLNDAYRLTNERDQLQAKLELSQVSARTLLNDLNGERGIARILLAHLGLGESAAFTEGGSPNPGRLKMILKELS